MSTMRAVRIHKYGGVEDLVLEEAPRPVAGDGEVLIRVHAAAVNPWDCAARAGYVTAYYTYAFPLILGLDVSGVVEAVGKGVAGFAPGDEVYARLDPARNGAYAEYVSVPASEVALKPPSLDHLQAAALPHVGLTAWRALIEAGQLAPGQTVLIHAAAGGVGSIAVQLAKWRGATVIGTASNYNLDFLKELGVDQALDYTKDGFHEVVRPVDVVLDAVGGDTQDRSWHLLKPGGVLLSIVQPPSQDAATAHGVRQQMVGGYGPAAGVLNEMASLVKSGKVKPVVSSILPLQDVGKAHALIEGKHVRGKIVLNVMG